VIGTDRWRSEPPCVSAQTCHMAKRRVGVEYSPSYAGAHAPKGGVTRPTGRCAFLPTFSHFLIVNKTSLSLSLSLSLCRFQPY
jgi:hypothetical protein